MLSLRLCRQRPFSTFVNASTSPRLINLQHLTRIRHPRHIESRCLQRCYAQASKKPDVSKSNISAAEQAKQQAKAAAANAGSKRYDIAERLLIYHAGTGRITFLAMVKVTTLFLGAFFTFIVVPGYVKAEKPEWEIMGVALCGLIPLFFVAYTTSPFTTQIYIHLPPAARTSRPALERFIHGALPPSTELTLTTMSAIAKPRYSTMQLGHLRPAKRRFGIVNYVRDAEGAMAENETRKWYNLRALTKFGVQEVKTDKKKKAKGTKIRDLTEAWIWDAVKDKIEKRATAAAAAKAS
ncbi:hypothetical protein BBK36DRAFT_1191828 [Trichoderma citrinoviride]|uniref:Uncharacterized protein n=1 Tax=Trichoderma citrinoviride TaxID=58853 RepID=A0A2T4BHG5_9HYPO|nr:hypothetical protein BBK36DRAFT_1191828 [Trichoderma citrinoviride]PTB68763.1 hypothetical protein BBK36DRAFT_1191828 [Trichoderma citrinoviride]